MAKSPLFIESIHLTEVSWKENADHFSNSNGQEGVRFTTEASVENHHEETNLWRVVLKVESSSDHVGPSHFVLIYTGVFRVEPGYPSEMAEKLVTINGSSILYSSAREMLSVVSGRSESGSMILPSISFVVPDAEPDENKETNPKQALKKKNGIKKTVGTKEQVRKAPLVQSKPKKVKKS